MGNIYRFDFNYDEDSDVLTIFDFKKPPFETIEFKDFINISINKQGGLVGVEIFDASNFFSALNKNVNKQFLGNLKQVELETINFRNNYMVIIWLESPNKQKISQQLPLISCRDYQSPLLAFA
jgi:uncharacterized protein YuzE